MQFLYLFLSINLGRKNPLYFLIFPLALVSGPGVFIDPRTVLFGDDLFIIGKNIYKDVIIIYLLIIAMYLSKRYKIMPFLKTPVLQYGFYILFLILLTLVSSGLSYEGLSVMRLFLYMVLGFFLLLIIFSTATFKQFVSFFNMLFWVTGALSVFYVLNSSKIFPIYYQEDLYQEIDMGDATFFRDFMTRPYFSHFLFILAFAVTILKSKMFNRKAVLFVLVTFPFVLLYTFTRSLLVAVLIECFLVLIVIALKKSTLLFSKTIISISIACMAIFFIVQTLFSNELAYYNSRIDSAKTEGANEGNVLVRKAYLDKAYSIVTDNNSLFTGAGLNKQYEFKMNIIGAWAVDSTIPFLLFYTGLLGVLFFFGLRIYFTMRAITHIRTFFNPFSIALFATISFSLVSTLIMGGNRWGDPFIFLPFVLILTIENLQQKDKIKRRSSFPALKNTIEDGKVPERNNIK